MTVHRILKLADGFLIRTKSTNVLLFRGNLAQVKHLLSGILQFLAELISIFLGILVKRRCLGSRPQGLSDLIIGVVMFRRIIDHLDLFLFRHLQERFPHIVFASS